MQWNRNSNIVTQRATQQAGHVISFAGKAGSHCRYSRLPITLPSTAVVIRPGPGPSAEDVGAPHDAVCSPRRGALRVAAAGPRWSPADVRVCACGRRGHWTCVCVPRSGRSLGCGVKGQRGSAVLLAAECPLSWRRKYLPQIRWKGTYLACLYIFIWFVATLSLHRNFFEIWIFWPWRYWPRVTKIDAVEIFYQTTFHKNWWF